MSLSAENLSVHLGRHEIVNQVSFSLTPGKLTGMIGPNGAGKSTLLRALAGTAPVPSGTIILDGQRMVDMPLRTRAKKLSYLPQEREVAWDLSVHDVVALGRHPYRNWLGHYTKACHDVIDQSLEEVGIYHLARRDYTTLSGGEKALTLLARSFAVGADILLVDEPVAGLDPYHSLQVMKLLRARAHAGQTILVVMHDLSLAVRFCDQAILMKDGKITDQGPPQKLLSNKMIKEVYGVTALMGEGPDGSWLIPWDIAESGERYPESKGYRSPMIASFKRR